MGEEGAEHLGGNPCVFLMRKPWRNEGVLGGARLVQGPGPPVSYSTAGPGAQGLVRPAPCPLSTLGASLGVESHPPWG